ncbi:hypothetical protein [Pseudovibrio denitrificans]|nr:hypothetical protein [Pseudovibrio denitrificans]
MAALASQQAEVDQSKASPGGGGTRKRGRRLLTFIGSSSGQSSLG